MKKCILALLALMFLVSPCFGLQTERKIIDTTISESNPAIEADLNIADSKRVAFFTTLVCNRTTASVTATITVAVSVDGVNWQDISWMDVAGGATPQTTETTTLTKQTYVGWLDNRIQAEYIRIRVQSSDMYLYSVTSGDSATVTVTVVEDK